MFSEKGEICAVLIGSNGCFHTALCPAPSNVQSIIQWWKISSATFQHITRRSAFDEPKQASTCLKLAFRESLSTFINEHFSRLFTQLSHEWESDIQLCWLVCASFLCQRERAAKGPPPATFQHKSHWHRIVPQSISARTPRQSLKTQPQESKTTLSRLIYGPLKWLIKRREAREKFPNFPRRRRFVAIRCAQKKKFFVFLVAPRLESFSRRSFPLRWIFTWIKEKRSRSTAVLS